ncbi:hypothetical protein VNO77_44745 [Canavalia gladiata]|uniref:Uncharacterized protein n=1 Tax=Canavalia gladiata TaxID=3824 RepID=A0AAN9JZH6_CANGL
MHRHGSAPQSRTIHTRSEMKRVHNVDTQDLEKKSASMSSPTKTVHDRSLPLAHRLLEFYITMMKEFRDVKVFFWNMKGATNHTVTLSLWPKKHVDIRGHLDAYPRLLIQTCIVDTFYRVLSVEISTKTSAWILSAVYGNLVPIEREYLGEHYRNLQVYISFPWILVMDFNKILLPSK